MSFDQAKHILQNMNKTDQTLNLIGQEDIFGMSYYIFNDRKNSYEDFMHGIIQ